MQPLEDSDFASLRPLVRKRRVAAGEFSWSRVVAKFEAYSKGMKAKEMKSSLNRLVSDYRSEVDPNVYALIILLCPTLDNRSFRLGNVRMADLLIHALSLARDGRHAKSLKDAARSTNSLAKVAYDTLEFSNVTCKSQRIRTIKQVNQFLDKLASISQEKVPSLSMEQTDLFREHLQDFSALEWKWIIRVILKDLGVRISEKMALSAIHPDAAAVYSVNYRQIRRVCEMLQDPNTRYDASSNDPVPGVPFEPQMAERPWSMQEVAKWLKGMPFFYLEDKVDGERIQLHKVGNTFKLFSRNAVDYTEMYSSVIAVIRQNNLIQCENCILDGEIVGFDAEKGCHLPFESIKPIACDLRDSGTKRYKNGQLCIVVFDMLHLGSTSLVHQSLRERRRMMSSVLHFITGRFELVKFEEVQDANRIAERIYRLGPGEEGLVVKDPDSTYVPGSRNGAGWIKLKPDYLSGATDKFDLVIVGRKGKDFVLAVMDDPRAGERPNTFRSFCKVGIGLSMQEHAALIAFLDRQAVGRPFHRSQESKLTDDSRYPNHQWGYKVSWSGGVEVYFSEDPDADMTRVYDPRTTKVLEIMADWRLILSTKYMAGLLYAACPVKKGIHEMRHLAYSPRFSRIVRIREDKGYWQCMCQSDLWKIVQKCTTDGMRDHPVPQFSEISTLKEGSSRKRALARRVFRRQRGRVLGVVDLRGVQKKWDVFGGRHICLLNNSNDDRYREKVARMAKEMNAQIFLHVDNNTAYIVTFGTRNEYYKGLKIAMDEGRCRKMDMLKPCWIEDCYKAAGLVPLHPRYMVYVSPETEKKFREQFQDKYDEIMSFDYDKVEERVDAVQNAANDDGGDGDDDDEEEEDDDPDDEEPVSPDSEEHISDSDDYGAEEEPVEEVVPKAVEEPKAVEDVPKETPVAQKPKKIRNYGENRKGPARAVLVPKDDSDDEKHPPLKSVSSFFISDSMQRIFLG